MSVKSSFNVKIWVEIVNLRALLKQGKLTNLVNVKWSSLINVVIQPV